MDLLKALTLQLFSQFYKKPQVGGPTTEYALILKYQ